MSGLFIGFIVLTIVAAVLLVIGVLVVRHNKRRLEDENIRRFDEEDAEGYILGGRIAEIVGGVALVIALVLFAFSFSARVSTNKVGIVTSFGKPSTALTNGWHAKAPWEKMVQFDGAQQPLQFGDGAKTDGDGGKTFGKVRVRLSGNATADISGTVTWQMRARTAEEKAQAVELFRQFRTFERVRDFFVWPNVQTALGETFDDFNPLIDEKNLSLGELNTQAASAIRAKFGDQLQVISVNLRVPDYDGNTDNAITALQAEKQKTETAKQKELTNDAEAKAAKALAAGNTAPPSQEVLVNKCLDIAKEQGKEPGYCFLQGGTPIIGAK